MASQTAEQVLKKYMDRMAAGSTAQAYKDGVDRVTESPMAKAADADQLYLARVQESVASGRRRQKLLETPLSRWKDNSKNKGAQRLASGAAASADKVRNHFTKWMPIYDNVRSTVAQMPKGTREDSAARARKAMDMLMDAAGRS